MLHNMNKYTGDAMLHNLYNSFFAILQNLYKTTDIILLHKLAKYQYWCT